MKKVKWPNNIKQTKEGLLFLNPKDKSLKKVYLKPRDYK